MPIDPRIETMRKLDGYAGNTDSRYSTFEQRCAAGKDANTIAAELSALLLPEDARERIRVGIDRAVDNYGGVGSMTSFRYSLFHCIASELFPIPKPSLDGVEPTYIAALRTPTEAGSDAE